MVGRDEQDDRVGQGGVVVYLGWTETSFMAKKMTRLLVRPEKKITGSIIGPAMAGPTGPFATAL